MSLYSAVYYRNVQKYNDHLYSILKNKVSLCLGTQWYNGQPRLSKHRKELEFVHTYDVVIPFRFSFKSVPSFLSSSPGIMHMNGQH